MPAALNSQFILGSVWLVKNACLVINNVSIIVEVIWGPELSIAFPTPIEKIIKPARGILRVVPGSCPLK